MRSKIRAFTEPATAAVSVRFAVFLPNNEIKSDVLTYSTGCALRKCLHAAVAQILTFRQKKPLRRPGDNLTPACGKLTGARSKVIDDICENRTETKIFGHVNNGF
jgi:hypothetical protein